MLATVDSLPRYMCTQTIDRRQFDPTPGRRESPCEPGPHKQTRLASSDRLRLDVAVSGHQEMYSWVGESHFDDRGLFDLVRGGALSTGAFSSFLAVVFRDDNTAFSDQGPVTEDGRRLERFDFHVPQAMSHYFYSGAGVRVATAYYGDILVDPATADLVRLEIHTEGLPPETGSCQSSSILDYTRMRLNDTDFLLPRRAELYILDASGMELKNTTVYSGCREFLGESTLHFESAPEAVSGGGPSAGAITELPAGLPFTIALNHAIDPATAAAGERVTAHLSEPIRDEQRRVLVPKNAAVSARILQISRFYLAVPAIRVKLKLETIEIAGAPRPLAAQPDTSRPPQPAARNTLQVRFNPVMVDNQDSHTAVLIFSSPKGGLFVPNGFELSWFTAAP